MSLLVLSGRRSKRPAAQPRPPLPPCPNGSYDRVLPGALPPGPRALRADLWGVVVPNLPPVPRGSSEHPERLLTWFLYKYARPLQDAGLTAHAVRSYTHFYLSWPDARDDGGLSIPQFVDLCRYVRSWDFWIGVFLTAKPRSRGNDIDGDPADLQAADRIAQTRPILEALLNADVVDELVPAWEMDAFNIPGGPTLDYARYVGETVHAAGKTCYLHFTTEKTSWFANGDPRGRFGFWEDLRGAVDGLNYQGDARWGIQEYQARAVDSLKQTAQQPWWDFRDFEQDASLEFAGDHPNEDDTNLRGFLICCTTGPARVWGFGNGARMPDGSPI